jgi:hypothetical protein
VQPRQREPQRALLSQQAICALRAPLGFALGPPGVGVVVLDEIRLARLPPPRLLLAAQRRAAA